MLSSFTVFSLVAPMGSFGGPAGHERRGSNSWPGRSAVLGLIGAALGVRRTDKEGQEKLRDWQCAVSVLTDRYPLQDFHTVQSVPTAAIKRPATRQAALQALRQSDNATITRRDYFCDCAFGVAVWGGSEPENLATALNHPVFVPFLGRKSCPLSAPMAARVVQADGPIAALNQVVLPPFIKDQPIVRAIVSDEAMQDAVHHREWNEPLNRELWHFGQQDVYISPEV